MCLRAGERSGLTAPSYVHIWRQDMRVCINTGNPQQSLDCVSSGASKQCPLALWRFYLRLLRLVDEAWPLPDRQQGAAAYLVA
jgi:hypothetical protein